jgi:AcrR family transcriptional regulator
MDVAIKKKKKHTRKQWLQKSLDVISGQGFGRIVIDNIVKSMEVTKGSFYWHFKDRNDFLEHLVTYWDESFTKNVMLHIGESKGDAAGNLLELMMYVTRKRLARYDAAILSLAHNEPHVSSQIAEVFESRIEFVATLFAEMGYKGLDMELRSRMIVTFMSQEQNILSQKPVKEQVRLIKKVYDLLIF